MSIPKRIIAGLDPGTEESALVFFDGEKVIESAILPNVDILGLMPHLDAQHLAFEMVACYGMPVGREVFETVLWTGRFIQACQAPSTKVYRKDVKLHLCGSPRAKDANIRQALLDRFGPGKEKAVGTKKSPGPLYGVKSHMWAALAVAVYWWDVERTNETSYVRDAAV